MRPGTMTESDDLERALTQRRPVWPYLAGFSVVLVGVAAAVLLWPESPQPNRVLVVADGLGDEAARRLVSAVRGPLAVGGLRVLEVDDGPPPTDPEGTRRVAFEAHAQHSVFLSVEVLDERERGAIEPAYVHVRGSAVVGDVAGGEPVAIAPVAIGAFGSTRAVALADAAERVGEALADAIHLAIAERPSVAAFVESTSVPTDAIASQAAMRAARDRVARVREELGWMQESCATAEAALALDDGPREVRCLSGACAEEYAFDVTPDGAAALVHSETPSARVPLVGELTVAERVESVERVEVVPLDGGPRRTIGTSNNYYTYPSMSADGRRVAVVEEWPRGFGLVVLDVETGARTVLARVERYLQSPRMSPDGAQVLASLRVRRRAPAQLVAMDVQVGATMRLLGESHLARWVRARAPDAEEPGLYVAELVPRDPTEAADELPEGEPTEPAEPEPADAGEPAADPDALPSLDLEHQLALLDPADGAVLARLDDDVHRVRRVLGAHDGAIVFTWFNRRVCGLGRWVPGARAAEVVRTPVCLRHAHLGLDGRVVGTAPVRAEGDPEAGDDELVEASFATGEVTALTANRLRERYPRVAEAAPRVIFDRLGESRYREFPRVALCWLAL